MKQIIGIDIGGTYIKAGIVEKGRPIKKIQIDTEAGKGKKKVLENITNAISQLMNKNISAIGIGCAGTIDLKKGIVVKSPNLPFRNVPLKKIIRNKFSHPVFLENDAKCFTIAEAVYGSGRNFNNVVGITLGTGLGGGISIEKKIYRGKGNAGEIGHMTIKFDGHKCSCGSFGCLEEYVSARGIMGLAKGINAKNPKELHELAKKGNKRAINAFEKMGEYLGIGIANIINSLDPEIIVVGGKIADSWKFFSRKMEEEVKKRAIVKPCRIIKSRLNDAGVIGAAVISSTP